MPGPFTHIYTARRVSNRLASENVTEAFVPASISKPKMRTFTVREYEIKHLAQRAWADQILISVVVDRYAPHTPEDRSAVFAVSPPRPSVTVRPTIKQ